MSATLQQGYIETQVQQADPLQLVAMLYDGALKHIRTAVALLESSAEGDGTRNVVSAGSLVSAPGGAEQAHRSMLKANSIVAELSATLDLEAGGEIALQLERIYDYVMHLLREADLQKSPAPLREAERLVDGLRQSWLEAFPLGLASLPCEMREQVGPQRQRARAGAAASAEQEAQLMADVAQRPHRSAQTSGMPALDLLG